MGIRGVLRKSWPAGTLVASLEQVAAGELYFEKALSDQFLMSRRKAVTHQEGRIIALLTQGKKNKAIRPRAPHHRGHHQGVFEQAVHQGLP